MRENTQALVSKEVTDSVAKALGVDIAQRLESLDDYALLSVYNYCVIEYWDGDYEIFTSLDEIADLWGNDSLGLAKAVAYGAGEDCFKSYNWLYFDGYGWIEVIDSNDRRGFMLEILAEFDKDKLHEALEACGYLEE